MMANAATMRILIKGGKVVNDDCTLEADVYIENGIIQQVGRELMIPGGAKVIDATGKLVIPGGIDTSTHFHQTFMNATCVDDFYHGTKAALVGGTTMIIGHVLPDKETSLLDAYEKCRSLADPKVCCDYALHMGITWWAPKVKAEMETLVREKGVNSFQMFMTYKDLYMLRDSELYQVLRACRDIGAIARVHAENGELVAEGAKEALDLGITGPEGIEISRPEELEAEATHRVITIANRTHCPVYLVNVSSMSAGDVIAAAKMQGRGHGWGPPSQHTCVGTGNPIDTGHAWGKVWAWRDGRGLWSCGRAETHGQEQADGHRNSCVPVGPCPRTGEHTWAPALLTHTGHTQDTHTGAHTHTGHTQDTYWTHTQDTHRTHTGHTQDTYWTHTQDTHRTHTGHTQDTYWTHTQDTHRTHTGHTQDTYWTHTQDTHRTHTGHTQDTYWTHTQDTHRTHTGHTHRSHTGHTQVTQDTLWTHTQDTHTGHTHTGAHRSHTGPTGHTGHTRDTHTGQRAALHTCPTPPRWPRLFSAWQGRWCTQRRPRRTPRSPGCTTTTRTGSTPQPTSPCRRCASTPTPLPTS
uniref:Dihydropyrimidinase like 5 n=10 Tax=Passeriformes TaxID=9126 RepID=A0A803VWV0_FICAL